MSWFGDGFNQLKGQLSSFAKVLVEDADGTNDNDPGNILVGSSQQHLEDDGSQVHHTRQRHASEGWTDVQLQAPSYDEIDKGETETKEISNSSFEEPVASRSISQSQSSTKINEKDVGALLRGGIASLIQKGKEQFEPLSPTRSTKIDQETQTDSRPEPEEFSVHDRIVSNLQQTIETLNQQNERLRNDVIRLSNELEAQAAASQDENANLSTGMEELDMQHQRAIERVLIVKEEALKEFELLKVKYASLEEEMAELRLQAVNAQDNVGSSRNKVDFAEELEERDREVECLEAENASLRDAIRDLTIQLDRSRETLPTVLEEPDEQNEELEILRSRVKDLEEGIKAVEEESVQAVDLLRKSNIALKSQLKEKNEEVEKAATDIKVLEEKCEGLEWETEELRTKVDCAKVKDLEMAKLRANLENAKTEIEEINNLRSELEQLQSGEILAENLKVELDMANARLAEIDELKIELENARIKGALSSELQAKLEEARIKASQVDDLKDQLEQAKIKESELIELKAKVKHLEDKSKEATELKSELDKLRYSEKVDAGTCTKVAAENSGFELELEHCRTKLAKSAVSLAQFEQELVKTLDQVHSLEKSLEDTKSINENLRREAETKDRRMCQILLESNASEQELQTKLQNERVMHEEAIKKYEQELSNSSAKVSELNNKLVEISVSSKGDDILKLQESIDQLNNEKVSLNETVLEFEMKMASLTSQNEQLQNDIALTNEKMLQHNEIVTAKERELSLMKAAIEKLQSEKKTEECNYISEIEKFRKESERYKIDREVFERMENEMKCRLQAKEEEMADFKQHEKVIEQDESLKNSIQEYQDLSSKYSLLVSDNDSLKAEISNVKEESNKKLARIENLEGNCATITKERDDLLLEICKLNEELKKITASNNPEKQQQLEQERVQFLGKIEKITEQNAELLADKSRLNAEYSKEKSSLIAGHSAEVTSLKTKIVELERQLEEIGAKYSAAVKKAKEDVSLIESERTELLRSIQLKHNECINYQTEVMRLNEVLKIEKSKIEKVVVEKAQLEMKCQSLKSLEDKISAYEKQVTSLETECQNLRDQLGYASELLKETKRQEAEGRCDSPSPSVVCPNGCAQTQEELNKLAWSLHTEQANTKTLQMQVSEFKEKAEKTETQLARLQNHLVELEAAQTEELVRAQETVTELRARLDAAEERARVSTTACTSANIRANQQVECLTQQVKLLTEQKEKLETEVSIAEDSSLKQQAAITNLQAVLHQFQLDKQRDIDFETERIHQKLNEAYQKNEEQVIEIKQLLDQLNEAKKGLTAASRLSEQLDKRTEVISNLQAEITILKEKLKKEEEKIKSLNSNSEGKVDRNLIKNLLVGYICAPDKSKEQVLRVLSSVLDLEREERTKIGLELSTSAQQQSLSQAFIKFLESESQPKPHLILSVPPTPDGPSRRTSQTSISGGSGSILLAEGIQTMGPSLVRSGAILKDVLKEPEAS